MEAFTLTQAAAWTAGKACGEAEIKSVSKDSNKIGEGCLFLAIKGERFDGHDFIEKAIENGAAAVLTARAEQTYRVPALYVEDTRQAILDLAAGYRAQFDCPVVAITGSVGKTTTKEMIASVLTEDFETIATEGNLNNQLGMPLTALRLGHTTEAAVFEMGMSAFGEISSMAAVGQPNIAVITTIGTSHIEFLGSREGICRAKLEILEGLAARGGVAVLNGDEPLLWDKRDSIYGRKIWFGAENAACDVRAEDIVCDADSVRFTVCLQHEKFPAEIGIAGRHNVTNALAAAACGWLLGMDKADIAAGLAAFRPSGRRQQLYRKNGFTIYEDCYNASPDSMEAALAVLGEQTGGRRLAVLGSMLELGDYAPEGHRRAGLAAARHADAAYLYGGNAADLREGALAGGMPAENVRIFDSHEALAQALRADAKTGDALLFKGSRGMKMEIAMKLFLGEDV